MQAEGNIIYGLETRKAEELLCYLLLYRDRPHPREHLADVLWGEISSSQSKNYLRKTLWQLQSGTDAIFQNSDCRRILSIDGEWIQVNSDSDIWLDTSVLEEAYDHVRGRLGRVLTEDEAQSLEQAVSLYRGNLLEGWYCDWCLYERERLQHLYLALLDKLMDYCEAFQLYENGLSYGERILRHDRARERTHRRLMRMHYLAGDRTAAIRQYKKCVEALHEELGVEPAKRTRVLLSMIQTDQLDEKPNELLSDMSKSEEQNDPLQRVFSRLIFFHDTLTRLQANLYKDIQAVRKAMK
jgi:DNA-binding SARP family transcriptional activator